MATTVPNKLVRIFLAALIIVAALYPLLSRNANAGALTAMSDTMTRQAQGVASNHTITFTMTAGADVVENETITITFATDFDTTAIDCGDVDLLDDGAEENLNNEGGGCSATATEWGAAMSSDVLTLTAPSNAATYIASSSVVVVEVGTNTAEEGPGNEQITNPGSAASYTIAINVDSGDDTGSMAVPILSSDQVTVSATVDPSITSTITGAPCTITPALTAAVVDSCSYTNQVATNAVSGYASTLLEDDDLETAGDTAIIDDVSDGTVTNNGGTAEYGASTSSTNVGSQDILTWDGTCELDASDNSEIASPITTTAKRYADHGGPVDETTTICHSASIIATTPAGAYSHVVTHITTGQF